MFEGIFQQILRRAVNGTMARRNAVDIPPATWKWPPLEPGETEAMREERIQAALLPLIHALADGAARKDYAASMTAAPMPEKRSRVTFREADLARLIRAARKAGETVHRVELAPDGTLKVYLQPGGTPGDAELDRELDAFERAQAEQRPATMGERFAAEIKKKRSRRSSPSRPW